MLELRVLSVGEFQSNCYLVVDPETQESVLIDAGAQAKRILSWLASTHVSYILVTHGHRDHTGALDDVRQALDVPVGIHPDDAEAFNLEADLTLQDGGVISIGIGQLEVVHLPGHTPGSVVFRIADSEKLQRAIVGDAIFPGGPGHTKTPDDLANLLDCLARTVFTWSDEVILYPGHGNPTTVGTERSAFEAFRSSPLPSELCGDVTWR